MMIKLLGFLPVCILFPLALCVEECSPTAGGGICPDGNTCCATLRGRMSGCISTDMGKLHGVCCNDSARSGCGMGYTCGHDENYRLLCINQGDAKDDPLVNTMPRYNLCSVGDKELNVLGIGTNGGGELAYYSSHGPLDDLDADAENIEMALIFVHGAGRNGDDYYCAATEMVKLQSVYKNVLVVSPRFYSENDTRPPNMLYWEDEGSGPWRYGQTSLGPGAPVSSFEAMDILVDTLWSKLPLLQHLTVAGHSAGGQFVQRWTLLTKHYDNHKTHSMVANPSSYAYLTPLRYIDGEWKLPNDISSDCPHYNQWEWGLDDGGPLHVEYRDQALQNTTSVIERFRNRKIVYLVGGQDRCNVSGHDHTGWCYSHGLETLCGDQLQGITRFERSELYYKSLATVSDGFYEKHIRHVVPGVGHDHSLMFQSAVGLQAVFEAFLQDKYSSTSRPASKTRQILLALVVVAAMCFIAEKGIRKLFPRGYITISEPTTTVQHELA